jgi:sialic acid synthase SpsE
VKPGEVGWTPLVGQGARWAGGGRIADVEIGPGQPCRIVCEVSNNHNGSLALAKRLVRECAEAGADLVKFQCYRPDELVALRGDGPAPDPWGSEGWSMRDLYTKAQTPHEWFPDLVAECNAAGVPWFSSVFGMRSMDLLKALGCPAYKIAALDVTRAMPSMLVGCDAPVIASSLNERIGWADLTLFCPPGYPQNPTTAAYGGRYSTGHHDGLSYHGTTIRPCLVAMEDGVRLVEVHVQLDDEPSDLEAHVSLTVSDLAKLCAAAKTARVA